MILSSTRVPILEFCSRFLTVPAPPDSPLTSGFQRRSRRPRSPRTAPSSPSAFHSCFSFCLPSHWSLIWNYFSTARTGPDSPARKSLNTCPGSRIKEGRTRPPFCTPISPALGAPCVAAHPPSSSASRLPLPGAPPSQVRAPYLDVTPWFRPGPVRHLGTSLRSWPPWGRPSQALAPSLWPPCRPALLLDRFPVPV